MTFGIPMRADWMTDAACRGHDPNWWHPAKGGDNVNTTKAKRICETCPVAVQCLQYALDIGEQTGIWGGVSVNKYRKEHGKTVTRRPKVNYGGGIAGVQHPDRWKPIEHGTANGYRAERRRGLKPCQPCTQARAEERRQLRNKGNAA
jgi:hypothetical protein